MFTLFSCLYLTWVIFLQRYFSKTKLKSIVRFGGPGRGGGGGGGKMWEIVVKNPSSLDYEQSFCCGTACSLALATVAQS